MKTFIFVLLLTILFIGCSNPVIPVNNNHYSTTINLYCPFDSMVSQYRTFTFQWYPPITDSLLSYNFSINSNSYQTFDTSYKVTLDTGTYHWNVSATVKNDNKIVTIHSKTYTLFLY